MIFFSYIIHICFKIKSPESALFIMICCRLGTFKFIISLLMKNVMFFTIAYLYFRFLIHFL